MAVIQIILPDRLAEEARSAGLLSPDQIERMLRDRLRAAGAERLREVRRQLAAEPLVPMTPAEIQAEIDAHRSGQRRASGS